MKATIRATDPDGCRVEFTTEDYKTPKLLDMLPKIKGYLLDRGYILLTNHPNEPASWDDQAGPTFAARELIPDVVGDAVYWRVLGAPPRHKFGCRVWPETLQAAGINPSQARKYDLAGWIAHCELRTKRDGEGTKEVVVRLERPPVHKDPLPESELDIWFPRNGH